MASFDNYNLLKRHYNDSGLFYIDVEFVISLRVQTQACDAL